MTIHLNSFCFKFNVEPLQMFPRQRNWKNIIFLYYWATELRLTLEDDDLEKISSTFLFEFQIFIIFYFFFWFIFLFFFRWFNMRNTFSANLSWSPRHGVKSLKKASHSTPHSYDSSLSIYSKKIIYINFYSNFFIGFVVLYRKNYLLIFLVVWGFCKLIKMKITLC